MNLPPGGPTEASWSLVMNYLTYLEFHGDLHALISISFFCSQVSVLVQFLIENCCRIFGEELTSVFAYILPKNDNREDSSGNIN